MKTSWGKMWAIGLTAAALAFGGSAAFADSIEPFGVTPEYTSRPMYLTGVTTSWQSDGSKTLTSGSYGQATVSRTSGLSSGNRLLVAPRNESGVVEQGPSYISRTGTTVKYVQNNKGFNYFFYPSLRTEAGSITVMSGTWSYYERG